MGKLKKIYLQDNASSSLQCRLVVRDIVWGIVQHIAQANDYYEQINIETQIDETSSDFIAALDSYGLLGEIPTQFGGNKRKSLAHNTHKVLKKPKYPFKISPDGRVVDHLKNSDDPQFDNLVFNSSIGEVCQIVGLSPLKGHYSARVVNSRDIINVSYINVRSLSREEYLEAHMLFRDDNDDKFPPSNVDSKYWDQRYRLFSKFDEGIELDAESWYSVTPECVSNYITTKCKIAYEKYMKASFKHAVVMDLFSGCGGNLISLANSCGYAIGVEIDPVKVHACRNNARIYGVSSKVEIICSDVFNVINNSENDVLTSPMHTYTVYQMKEEFNSNTHIRFTDSDNLSDHNESQIIENSFIQRENEPHPASRLVDIIVISPPWGGPEYLNLEKFDLHTMLPTGDVLDLLQQASKISNNIVLIIPRNSKVTEITDIARSLKLSCTIEDIHLHKKLKLKIVYFGSMLTKSIDITASR